MKFFFLIKEILPQQKEEMGLQNLKFEKIKFFEKLWKIKTQNLNDKSETIYVTPYISIASGHHGTPTYANFLGQESFKGS